jgi:hypothetical protein
MSERISAKLFSGACDELRASPEIRSGGVLAGCGDEGLSHVAPRIEPWAGAAMDFADPRCGEPVDSFSGLRGPEKQFSLEAFDDLWE